ncbi:MAG: EAL domain-containing protein [Thiobacillus sp.]|nr:EAL domain-containing protein [Thiobacillus sp.]
MLLVALIASALLFTVGALSYRLLNQRELALRHDQIQQHYGNTLPRLENSRYIAAVQLGSRMEFSKILERDGASRWPVLAAFLDAQWVFGDFSNMVILDAGRRVLYHYGSEAEILRNLATGKKAWLHVPQNRLFYRVYRVPLRLGAQDQGELVLFKTLSDSLMRELAIPQTHLQLIYNGRGMAISKRGLGPELNQPDRFLRVDVPWPKAGADGEVRPMLVVYRDLEDIYPFSYFVMRPIMVSLVILVLLWFGLGRWISRTTLRIASLGHGARHYADGHDRASLGIALTPALSHDDEIRETARAFDHLVQAVEARDQEQRGYLETLALLEEAVIEFDADGRIQHASPGWNKLTRRDNSLGCDVHEFIDEDDVPMLQSQTALLFRGDKHIVALRIRLRAHDGQGSENWVEARLLAFDNQHGKAVSIRGVLRDITQNHLHEQQITHMALHDALTELPNRVLLEDRFKVALRLASRNHDKVAVCFIDLDHFKTINDTLGHKAGDRLLLAFSERLRQELRAGDTLARWGGDEFVLLLPDMESEAGVRQVTEKVISALQHPLELDGSDIRVTFSMGAAIYPIDGDDMETLFSQADRAMFYAKAQGRNQVCFFQDMTSKGIGKKDLYIQNRLAAAIDQGLIQTWFQPIVDAATGRCTAVEVLARWHDAEHGWISPATFIPMAENLGLIHVLGNQILLGSLDSLKHLQGQGRDILMAVNISRRQLFIRSFAERLAEEVGNRGLQPGQLILEVTESVALNDVERGADHVQVLRQAGFLIAIDDFGTGYSSLSQLHEMNVVELKIDISFVRRLHEPAGKSMVQAIVNMAHALGLKTVAEGVETQEAADILGRIGVSCLQGYLFGKAMPLDQLEIWLGDNAARTGQGVAAPAAGSTRA